MCQLALYLALVFVYSMRQDPARFGPGAGQPLWHHLLRRHAFPTPRATARQIRHTLPKLWPASGRPALGH